MSKHLSQYTDEKSNKESDDSLKIWNNLENWRKKDDYHLESNSLMHPSVFYELSSVDGFNKKNGFTYREYTNLWHERSNT